MGGTGVLEGIKVLELGSGAAGPVATRYLVEQGATVVRIESSKRPDFLRILWLTPDSKHGVDGSPMFILLNPDKLSLTLDMTRPEGIAVAKRLVAWADVVAENFAPGPMAKWGMDYESLRSEKPDLVMVSGCLFGQTGPHRRYPGFGGQGSAISGYNHITGWPDRPSQGPSHTITDSLSPRYVALAIVGALLERERTGRGQYIDISQIETGVYSNSEMIVRYSANGEIVTRNGNRSEQAVPHAVYPCRGKDRWIAIAILSDGEWQALCNAMGNPEGARDEALVNLRGRRAAEERLDAALSEWTAGFEAHELMQRLQAAGVEAAVVQSYADLLEDPQLAHRSHFQELEHMHLGSLQFERPGFRLSESPGAYEAPGPNLGEHNQWVLAEILGMDPAEIAELEEGKILV